MSFAYKCEYFFFASFLIFYKAQKKNHLAKLPVPYFEMLALNKKSENCNS